jgi:cytochrome b561
MDFKLQAFGPFLHWMTLVALFVTPVLVAYVIYRLGNLPGAIARSRNHPQAEAISICGWMGIITLVLWPLALIWAYYSPSKLLTGSSAAETEHEAMIRALHEARQRLAALESRVPHQRSAAGG